MRRVYIAAPCILSFCNSGCSFIVASQTREISEAVYERASREKIEKMTGPPIVEEKFSPPYPATRRYEGPVGFALTKAKYIYHGRADDQIEFQDLGMLVGLTWGLGEVVAFPIAIQRSHKLKDPVHHYEAWYDVNCRCVGFKSDDD